MTQSARNVASRTSPYSPAATKQLDETFRPPRSRLARPCSSPSSHNPSHGAESAHVPCSDTVMPGKSYTHTPLQTAREEFFDEKSRLYTPFDSAVKFSAPASPRSCQCASPRRGGRSGESLLSRRMTVESSGTRSFSSSEYAAIAPSAMKRRCMLPPQTAFAAAITLMPA